MIISLTTSFPTFSFRALISPSLTIIISFLTTAEVKETKSLPSITRTLFVLGGNHLPHNFRPDHTNLMLLKFLFKAHITKHLVDQLIDLFCFPLFHKQGTEFPFSNYLQI